MTPEESKDLKELVEFLKENNISEFDFERADVKLRIKFGQQGHASAPSAAELAHLRQLLGSQPPPAGHESASRHEPIASGESETGAREDADLHIVKSPIVGTFYESPSPGAAAFVKIGDQVENGQVLCIVEAMKLMNEIESDAAGEVVKRFVSSGQPVEYGQPLFALRSR